MDEIKKFLPLWGSWNLEKKIGQGSFGSVYLASKDLLNKKCYSVIKHIVIPNEEMLKSSVFNSRIDSNTLQTYVKDMVENYVTEIEILNKLKGHSNIISLEDYMVEQREELKWDLFIRMEKATSLSEHLKRVDFTEKDLFNLAIQICSGLEICHKNNIIHRDIKEDNLFISDIGNFKIGDFGISKLSNDLLKTRIGTPIYLAPEIIKGEEYSTSVDIYSFGITLYKIANNGNIPFLSDKITNLKVSDIDDAESKRIKGEKFPNLNRISAEFSNIILKACEYDPRNRYLTISEMISDLYKISKNNLFDNKPLIDLTLVNTNFDISTNKTNFSNTKAVSNDTNAVLIEEELYTKEVALNQATSNIISKESNNEKLTMPISKERLLENKKIKNPTKILISFGLVFAIILVAFFIKDFSKKKDSLQNSYVEKSQNQKNSISSNLIDSTTNISNSNSIATTSNSPNVTNSILNSVLSTPISSKVTVSSIISTDVPSVKVVPNELKVNSPFRKGEYLKSSNGLYTLTFQNTGILVLEKSGSIIWSSSTQGTNGEYCIFRTNGQFAMFNSSDTIVWSTTYAGESGGTLRVTNDGKLAIYNKRNILMWNNGNTKDSLGPGEKLLVDEFIYSPKYKLIMQGDGNLVLLDSSGKPIWSSITTYTAARQCRMNTNGNLELLDNSGNLIASSDTSGNPNSSLRVQDDGNTVIYNSSGTGIWCTVLNGMKQIK